MTKAFFFQWPFDVPEYVDALGALSRQGLEPSYFVYSADPALARQKFPKAIFHNHTDAYDGVPPQELVRFDLPADAPIIKDMAEAESIILSMMHKHFDSQSLDERKLIYYNMLGYWYRVLKEYRPDTLVFSAVPHSVYDYLCYALAKRLGIKTILFDYTLIEDRYACMTDWKKGSQSVALAFAALASSEPPELSRAFQNYYQRFREHFASNVPLYVTEDKKKYSAWNAKKTRFKVFFESLHSGRFRERVLSFISKMAGGHIKREYHSVARTPELEAPFVYFPLNYQPECTTSPQGDIFVVQSLCVEMLAAALPEGWRLYVKEHPSQWGPRGLNFSSSRYKGFYRRLAGIKGVTIVPLDVRSDILTGKAKAVATVSGTAAWEALLREIPAIIFGHPWYQQAPGLLHAESVESCRKHLLAIQNGRIAAKDGTIRFLKALEEGTVHAHFQEYARRHSPVSAQESANEVIKAILQALATP